MNSCVSALIGNENYPVIMQKISNKRGLTYFFLFFYRTSNLQLAPDMRQFMSHNFHKLVVHGKVALSNLALGSFRIHRE